MSADEDVGEAKNEKEQFPSSCSRLGLFARGHLGAYPVTIIHDNAYCVLFRICVPADSRVTTRASQSFPFLAREHLGAHPVNSIHESGHWMLIRGSAPANVRAITRASQSFPFLARGTVAAPPVVSNHDLSLIHI